MLIRNKPDLADAIGALDWVADGVDDSERDALERIIALATRYETTAQTLMGMAWIADGVSDIEAEAIVELGRAPGDLAERIIAMPWLADGVSYDEWWVIRYLRSIARRSTADLAESVLALPWLADSVSDSERSAISWLFYITASSATTAESVIALPWVADEVSDAEVDSLESLYRITQSSAAVAKSVVALPWIADGVSDSEATAVASLVGIASHAAAERIVALPWVADGVSDDEASVIHSLGRMQSATVAASVLALPWVADGLSDGEADFIIGLGLMPRSIRAAAERIVALPWVADGVSDREASFTMALYYIAHADADAALRVMGMQFLQTPEAADMAALDTLAVLAFSDADLLADALSRPMLKDGITDDEAPIVSMITGDPDLDDRLLDPDKATVERRTVDLPLAGEVDLVIVRTYLGVKRSMDLLENAVREAENLMGEPLPTRYVGVLFGDVFGDSSSAVGINYGSHIAILPEYDADDGSYAAGAFPSVIAHEVAHYYWSDSAVWLAEGMAELMASAIENRRVGTPISFTRRPCEFARSIKELEALTDSGQRWRCSYPLGEGLFVSLLRTLGEYAFWDSARNLYASSRAPYALSQARWLHYKLADLLDPPAGIDEVYEAFGENVAIVIRRWYEGK